MIHTKPSPWFYLQPPGARGRKNIPRPSNMSIKNKDQFMGSSRENVFQVANSPIIAELNYKADKCILAALDGIECSLGITYKIGNDVISKAEQIYTWDASMRILTVSATSDPRCKFSVPNPGLPQKVFISEEKEAEFRAKMARL